MKGLQNLNLLLKLLEESTVEKLTVYEHFILQKGNLENKLSIRIDVDYGLACAEALAVELNKRNIRASFYFLTLTAPYNIFNNCIKKIFDLGHEVGLHTDHLYLNKAFGLNSLELLQKDITILSTLIGEPIKGMCFHGNGMFEFQHNWSLYREIPPAELGLVYHDGFTSSYCKLSSRNIWAPPVKNFLSDDPDGLLTDQSSLKSFFKNVNDGQSSHLIIHPQYFYEPSSWANNSYHEKTVPLPKQNKNRLLKINKLIKFGFNKLFICLEVIIRMLCLLIMHIVGSKKNSGKLEEFGKMDFITQSYVEPNNFNKIIEGLHIEKEDIVLDIGFGAGQFLFLTADKAKTVYGVEPAVDLFNYVDKKIKEKNLKNINICKGVGEKLDFENFTFDKAICMSVLMMTNPYNVLREINRVLKKGGVLTMHVSDIGYSLHSLRDGIMCKNPSRIKGTLKQLMAKFRRSLLRQYNVGGVFTLKDLQVLAAMTGFEIVDNVNEGYYDWEPKTFMGYTTQHLIKFRKK